MKCITSRNQYEVIQCFSQFSYWGSFYFRLFYFNLKGHHNEIEKRRTGYSCYLAKRKLSSLTRKTAQGQGVRPSHQRIRKRAFSRILALTHIEDMPRLKTGWPAACRVSGMKRTLVMFLAEGTVSLGRLFPLSSVSQEATTPSGVVPSPRMSGSVPVQFGAPQIGA